MLFRSPLGKVDGVLMFGRKGVGRVFLGFVGVGHVVDAQTDDVLRRRRDGTFRRDGLNRQRRDACDGQQKPGPHLRGQERDGVGQCLVRKAQPAIKACIDSYDFKTLVDLKLSLSIDKCNAIREWNHNITILNIMIEVIMLLTFIICIIIRYY